MKAKNVGIKGFYVMVAVVVAILAGGASAVLAGEPCRGGPHGEHGPRGMHDPMAHAHMFLDKLDLSQVQMKRIQELVTEFHQSRPLRQGEEIHEAHRALMEAIHDPDATEEQVLDASRNVSAIEQQRALEWHRMTRAILDLLTEEQLQRLEELKREIKQFHEQAGSDPHGEHPAHGFHGGHGGGRH